MSIITGFHFYNTRRDTITKQFRKMGCSFHYWDKPFWEFFTKKIENRSTFVSIWKFRKRLFYFVIIFQRWQWIYKFSCLAAYDSMPFIQHFNKIKINSCRYWWTSESLDLLIKLYSLDIQCTTSEQLSNGFWNTGNSV